MFISHDDTSFLSPNAELCRAATVTPGNSALSLGVGTNDVL
jgi:hypothetical protein